MTQPATESPPQPDGAGAQVAVGVAVVGLALLAVESRVRGDVADALAKILVAWAALVAAVITAGRVRTGTELLSRSDVHGGLTRSLTALKGTVTSTVRGGYTAAAQLAAIRASRDLKKLGHDTPSTVPDLGTALSTIEADINTAFAQAMTDVQNSVRDAFDGVQGDSPTAARVLTVDQAVKQAVARLRQRLDAAAAVAVHRGSRDAQLAAFREFEQVNPYIGLRKRWRVTAVDPCGMCRALDGSIVGVDAEFDREANSGSGRLRGVYGDLLGPPRHPNCRCQLELVTA